MKRAHGETGERRQILGRAELDPDFNRVAHNGTEPEV